MKLAVVIVNYRTERWVLRCLSSLERLARRDLMLIVVDNSPAPDTDRVRERHPMAVVLRPDRNLGFAGGCNRGIEHALDHDADFVLLLNPDSRAEDDFLQPMLDTLRENPDLGVVAPKILRDGRPEQILYAGGRVSWWRGGPRHLVEDSPREPRSWQPAAFVSGCAMLVRSQTLRRVGPLDEKYFLYFEDADYAQSCLAAGWGVAYVPGARIHHRESSSINRRGVEHTYLYSRNRLWFLRRWSPRLAFAGYLLFTLFLKVPGAFLLLGSRLGFAFGRGVWHGLVRSPR